MRLLLLVFIPLFLFAKPFLLLHFDINQTIIASDQAGNRSIEDVINHSLSHRYKDYWDSRLENPVSYYEYIFDHALPGSNTDRELKKKRRQKLSGFVEYLEEINHPLCIEARELFTQAMDKLTKEQIFIFPSFYNFIHYLNEQEYGYCLIIRTFGHDLDRVLTAINQNGYDFAFARGKFDQYQLLLEEGTILQNMDEVYNFLKEQKSLALQDDWYYWNSHEETSFYGKRFPIDLDDASVVSIFFDDHIKESFSPNYGIVAPIDVKTQAHLSDFALVQEGNLVRVDTLDAILNDHYFIDILQKKLHHIKSAATAASSERSVLSK